MNINKYMIGRFHARFDTFGGLIPVKPIRKIFHTDFQNITREYIRVKVLESISGYKKDEILEIQSDSIIPLKQIKYPKGCHARIFGNYMWLDLFPEYNKDLNYRGKL